MEGYQKTEKSYQKKSNKGPFFLGCFVGFVIGGILAVAVIFCAGLMYNKAKTGSILATDDSIDTVSTAITVTGKNGEVTLYKGMSIEEAYRRLGKPDRTNMFGGSVDAEYLKDNLDEFDFNGTYLTVNFMDGELFSVRQY